jgi:hypothetical protein
MQPRLSAHQKRNHMRPNGRVLFAAAVCAAAVAVIQLGCEDGPARGEVSGKVTFKGNPVKEGLVTFLNPKEGGAHEANIQPDGSYAIQGGAVVGEYVVEIKPLVVIVDTDPGKSPPAPVEKAAPDIPKKYRMQGTTPLTAAVKQGKNEINFEMKP